MLSDDDKSDLIRVVQQDASPMIKKIQDLEETIGYLTRNSNIAMELRDQNVDLRNTFQEYQQDNGAWKLGVKGDIVSLNQCYLELAERIKEISNWMLDKQERFKYFDDSIDKLENFNTDILHDFERRLIKLESSKLSQELDPKVWFFVNERLDKLESKTMIMIDIEEHLKQISWVHQQINRLDTIISSLVDKIADIANYCYKEKKTPHKCPVCEGIGSNKPELRATMQSMSIDGVQCKAGESVFFKASCRSCEGKGVLWG